MPVVRGHYGPGIRLVVPGHKQFGHVRDRRPLITRVLRLPLSPSLRCALRTLAHVDHVEDPFPEPQSAVGATPGRLPPCLDGDGLPSGGVVLLVVPPVEDGQFAVLEEVTLLGPGELGRLPLTPRVDLALAAEADVPQPRGAQPAAVAAPDMVRVVGEGGRGQCAEVVVSVLLGVLPRLGLRHRAQVRVRTHGLASLPRPLPPITGPARRFPIRVLFQGVLEAIVRLTAACQAPGQTPRLRFREGLQRFQAPLTQHLRDVGVTPGPLRTCRERGRLPAVRLRTQLGRLTRR